jgi:hypothetical protein
MILGIVGSEARKFTNRGRIRAKKVIMDLINYYGPKAISSGRCSLGGIDIWVEEIARDMECFNEKYIFPAKVDNWADGFKPRNIEIAQASDVVICISVDTLPREYEGRTFPICYHCLKTANPSHIKSGGCWTVKHAKSLGKMGRLIVVRNYGNSLTSNL